MSPDELLLKSRIRVLCILPVFDLSMSSYSLWFKVLMTKGNVEQEVYFVSL